MRTKTAYRDKPENIPAENPEIPKPAIEIKHDGTPADVTTATREVPATEEEYNKQVSDADQAKLALVRQIEELRKSELLQREHAIARAQAQVRPITREQKLHLWRSQGMSDAEDKFLQANPELIDDSQRTALAAAEAERQGHTRGTAEHMQTTKRIFHEHAAPPTNPIPETPAFFEPPASSPAASNPGSLYAAPVSREGGGYRQSSNSVTLTREDKEHARIAGVSEVEYARQKKKLAEMKASGLYGESR
jgi:hypothetical protein